MAQPRLGMAVRAVIPFQAHDFSFCGCIWNFSMAGFTRINPDSAGLVWWIFECRVRSAECGLGSAEFGVGNVEREQAIELAGHGR